MRGSWIAAAIVVELAVTVAGCRSKAVDKVAFKSALDNYYTGHPECVWAAPVKLPAQASASNDEQTKGFDALTDAGLLTRTPEEKKRFLIGSKQVNDYDLSAKGRAVWTADPTQPGYGNFCYGDPELTAIDGFTPANDSDATQYTVNYHYAVAHPPEWANSAEMKTAFAKVAADTDGQQTATATLNKSSTGWAVTNVQPTRPGTMSPTASTP